MEKRDLLSLRDVTRGEIDKIFSLAGRLKSEQKREIPHQVLSGKTLALVFQKPSLRTRVSFEIGMIQLGGHTVFLGPEEIHLGVREPVADCARNLSRWVDIIVMRTFSHESIMEMGRSATVPVINGLTELYHPCQVMADCFTLLEHNGKLEGLKIAFVGDGNNMVHSWIEAAKKFSFFFSLACPKGYEPNPEVTVPVDKSERVFITHDVGEAVRGADVLYTDVWASMGHESEQEARRAIFENYQVNKDVVAMAKDDVLIMHCLPAHRGEEITAEILEDPRSVIFDQAENRLHVQKAIMVWLLKGDKGFGRGRN
ncbi:MAG: ornithine carbamoyltransferase [Candidatus Binatia bacterium]